LRNASLGRSKSARAGLDGLTVLDANAECALQGCLIKTSFKQATSVELKWRHNLALFLDYDSSASSNNTSGKFANEQMKCHVGTDTDLGKPGESEPQSVASDILYNPC
jgi:hypothetical protein